MKECKCGEKFETGSSLEMHKSVHRAKAVNDYFALLSNVMERKRS